MPRNKDDVRRKLQEAALELYRKRGYDRTTTAEIAERAGVTERTYFRHFADKREVLFDGENELRAVLAGAVAAAPAKLGAMDALLFAFQSVAHLFEEHRAFSEPAEKIIEANPALQERALTKAGVICDGLAEALAARGVEGNLAKMAAEMGMIAMSHARRSWLADASDAGLKAHLEKSFRVLQGLSALPATAPKRRKA